MKNYTPSTKELQDGQVVGERTPKDEIAIHHWNEPPEDEIAIHWNVPMEELPPFVRVRVVYSHFRARPLGKKFYYGTGKAYGYSILGPRVPKHSHFRRGRSKRRMFYCNALDLRDDCIYKKTGGMPSEGVDPRTVAPGVWGVHIDSNQGANDD